MVLFKFYNIKNTFLLLLITAISCGKSISQKKSLSTTPKIKKQDIVTGASRIATYLPLLKNKRVALVGNPTSIVFNPKHKPIHLVDTLLQHQVTITKVFAPEHGFRGKADAGEYVKNGIDTKTNIPIISLYGKNKKPSPEVLSTVDIVVFDIQDVGARFYTYISSLHYVMEACAESNIPVLVLDRPNPNGHYVDGPILNPEFKSFVGLHPIPIVHGMTIGEYAQMINGQQWLNNSMQCDLKVIKMENYNHHTPYELPIKPSPNLPNAKAINLYPSLCLFEGTTVSVGRGTNMQFQVYGSPKLPKTEFNFIPKPNSGSKHPKHENTTCFGADLRSEKQLNQLQLGWLLKAYKSHPKNEAFFNAFFKKLAGSNLLQQQIEQGLTEQQIRDSWKAGLKKFNSIRNQYLIYN